MSIHQIKTLTNIWRASLCGALAFTLIATGDRKHGDGSAV